MPTSKLNRIRTNRLFNEVPDRRFRAPRSQVHNRTGCGHRPLAHRPPGAFLPTRRSVARSIAPWVV